MTFREKTLADLRALLAAYAEHQGLKPSTVTGRLLRDPKFAARLEAGDDFRTQTYDLALAAFAAAWPEDLPWPAGVPVPDAPRQSA